MAAPRGGRALRTQAPSHLEAWPPRRLGRSVRRSRADRRQVVVGNFVATSGEFLAAGDTDDPNLMGEILDAVQEEARLLLGVLLERSALRHAGLSPIVEEERGTPAGLCAIVTALDAEVRLGELGDTSAPARAFVLASELVAGVDVLAGAEDC